MSGSDWLEKISWSADGLLPVIAQDADSGEVLMFAWMNRQALAETARSGEAVYFSRSRQRLWRKGESSGHVQKVREMLIDCDHDCLLLKVEQTGGIACHTGRRSCFFERRTGDDWVVVSPVLKDPGDIYGG